MTNQPDSTFLRELLPEIEAPLLTSLEHYCYNQNKQEWFAYSLPLTTKISRKTIAQTHKFSDQIIYNDHYPNPKNEQIYSAINKTLTIDKIIDSGSYLIYGKAGSGKTHLLKSIYYQLKKSNDPLIALDSSSHQELVPCPIYIDVLAIPFSYSLTYAIYTQLKSLFNCAEDEMDQWMKIAKNNQQFIFLIDNLDKVSISSQKFHLDGLKSLQDTWQTKLRLVFAIRPHGLTHLHTSFNLDDILKQNFHQWQLLPLQQQQQINLLNGWFDFIKNTSNTTIGSAYNDLSLVQQKLVQELESKNYVFLYDFYSNPKWLIYICDRYSNQVENAGSLMIAQDIFKHIQNSYLGDITNPYDSESTFHELTNDLARKILDREQQIFSQQELKLNIHHLLNNLKDEVEALWGDRFSVNLAETKTHLFAVLLHTDFLIPQQQGWYKFSYPNLISLSIINEYAYYFIYCQGREDLINYFGLDNPNMEGILIAATIILSRYGNFEFIQQMGSVITEFKKNHLSTNPENIKRINQMETTFVKCLDVWTKAHKLVWLEMLEFFADLKLNPEIVDQINY